MSSEAFGGLAKLEDSSSDAGEQEPQLLGGVLLRRLEKALPMVLPETKTHLQCNP